MSADERAELLKDASAYEARLAVDSSDRKARYALAHALRRLGRTSDAIEHFRNIIGLHPTDCHASLAGLAACLLDAGQPEEALDAVRRAMQHLKESPSAHALLGECLLALDRVQEAVSAFEAGLEHALPHEEAEYRLLEGLESAHRRMEGKAG